MSAVFARPNADFQDFPPQCAVWRKAENREAAARQARRNRQFPPCANAHNLRDLERFSRRSAPKANNGTNLPDLRHFLHTETGKRNAEQPIDLASGIMQILHKST